MNNHNDDIRAKVALVFINRILETVNLPIDRKQWFIRLQEDMDAMNAVFSSLERLFKLRDAVKEKD